MSHINDINDTKRRILEIEVELARQKRSYVVEGARSDVKSRFTLEAELAVLSLARHDQRVESQRAKDAATQFKSATFLRLLIAKIKAANLSDLVEEAHQESLAALKAAGLGEDYRIQVKESA